MPARPSRPVGFHVSVAGGLRRAFARARRRGCDALQVFPSNPRGWAVRQPDLADEDALACLVAEAGFPLFLHAPYLVNLASPDPAVRERSVSNLAFALERGARLAGTGVVVHTGSARGDARAVAVRRTADAVLGLLDRVAGCDLVIELTAGSGDMLAGTLEELADLLDACGWHPRIGVCLDTCHLFAAGVDWTIPSGLRRVRAGLDAIGPARLELVHVNDTRDPLGSRRDRHARVGRGVIGVEPFRRLLRDRRLHGVPLVLETPGTVDEQAEDVALVRSLVGRAPRARQDHARRPASVPRDRRRDPAPERARS